MNLIMKVSESKIYVVAGVINGDTAIEVVKAIMSVTRTEQEIQQCMHACVRLRETFNTLEESFIFVV